MQQALIERRLRAALDSLPNDADDIALYFRSEGIKGRVAEACDCPVAVYLTRELGDLLDSRNGEVSYWVTAVATYDETMEQVIVTPESSAVQMFARGFDRGYYPDLIVDPQETE